MPSVHRPGHAFADLKTTRAISADITKYGAALHEVRYCHKTRTKRRRDAFRRVLVGAGRARRRKGGCRSCAGQASRRRLDAQAACEAAMISASVDERAMQF